MTTALDLYDPSAKPAPGKPSLAGLTRDALKSALIEGAGKLVAIGRLGVGRAAP